MKSKRREYDYTANDTRVMPRVRLQKGGGESMQGLNFHSKNRRNFLRAAALFRHYLWAGCSVEYATPRKLNNPGQSLTGTLRKTETPLFIF